MIWPWTDRTDDADQRPCSRPAHDVCLTLGARHDVDERRPSINGEPARASVDAHHEQKIERSIGASPTAFALWSEPP